MSWARTAVRSRGSRLAAADGPVRGRFPDSGPTRGRASAAEARPRAPAPGLSRRPP